MPITVLTSMRMGKRLAQGDSYFGLAIANQKDFKAAFATELEDDQTGIPATVRDMWLDVAQAADIDGHIDEAIIASKLTTTLTGYVAPRAQFELDTPGPVEVIYMWVNGKRVCYHRYLVRRAVDGGAFTQWSISRTYGQAVVTADVVIDYYWPTTY